VGGPLLVGGLGPGPPAPLNMCYVTDQILSPVKRAWSLWWPDIYRLSKGRILDRSPPWTALACTCDHQNDGHRYRLRPFVSRDTAAPEQLPDLDRSLTSRQSGQAAPEASTITGYRLASFCHCLQQPLIYHPYSRLIIVFTIVSIHLWKKLTRTRTLTLFLTLNTTP